MTHPIPLCFDQEDLDKAAENLNSRPRKALDYTTPSEQFRLLVAGLAAANEAPAVGVRSET